jgi:hypothetical protein
MAAPLFKCISPFLSLSRYSPFTQKERRSTPVYVITQFSGTHIKREKGGGFYLGVVLSVCLFVYLFLPFLPVSFYSDSCLTTFYFIFPLSLFLSVCVCVCGISLIELHHTCFLSLRHTCTHTHADTTSIYWLARSLSLSALSFHHHHQSIHLLR